MCIASTADDAPTIGAGGIGNGIIATRRSSAATVATRTFSAISTASSSTGATTAAGAPAGRPIGANRA
jgi:hypothetical protein